MNVILFEKYYNQDHGDDAQEDSKKSRPSVQIEVKFNGVPFKTIITKWLK